MRRFAALVGLVLVVVGGLFASPALADGPRVAVLPFEGPEAIGTRAAMQRALERLRVDVVPLGRAADAARRAGVRGLTRSHVGQAMEFAEADAVVMGRTEGSGRDVQVHIVVASATATLLDRTGPASDIEALAQAARNAVSGRSARAAATAGSARYARAVAPAETRPSSDTRARRSDPEEEEEELEEEEEEEEEEEARPAPRSRSRARSRSRVVEEEEVDEDDEAAEREEEEREEREAQAEREEREAREARERRDQERERRRRRRRGFIEMPWLTAQIGGSARLRDAAFDEPAGTRFSRAWYPSIDIHAELRPFASVDGVERGFFIRTAFFHSVGLRSRGADNEVVDTTFFGLSFDSGLLLAIERDWEVGFQVGIGVDHFGLGDTAMLVPSAAYGSLRPGLRGRVRLIQELLTLELNVNYRWVFERGQLSAAFGSRGESHGVDASLILGGAVDVGFSWGITAEFVTVVHQFNGGDEPPEWVEASGGRDIGLRFGARIGIALW